MKDPSISAPWLGKEPYSRTSGGVEAGKDNTWSADTQDPDDDGAAAHNRTGSSGTERGGNQEEDEYRLLHANDADRGRNAGRRWDDDLDHDHDQHNRYDVPPQYEDTAYRGSGRQSYHPPGAGGHDDYDDHSGAAFPSAPYGYGGPITPREGI
jgi:hypothetical protein